MRAYLSRAAGAINPGIYPFKNTISPQSIVSVPARVQHTGFNNGTNYQNSVSMQWGSNNLAGDFLVAFIATSNNATTSITSVSDTPNGNWTKYVGYTNTTNSSLDIWYVKGCAAGVTPTLTVALSGYYNVQAVLAEYKNIVGTIDKFAALQDSGYVTTHTIGPTGTPTAANEIVAGGYACNSGAVSFVDTSGTYSLITEAPAGGNSMVFGDKIVNSVGTQQMALTSSGSTNGQGYLVTIK